MTKLSAHATQRIDKDTNILQPEDFVLYVYYSFLWSLNSYIPDIKLTCLFCWLLQITYGLTPYTLSAENTYIYHIQTVSDELCWTRVNIFLTADQRGNNK